MFWLLSKFACGILEFLNLVFVAVGNVIQKMLYQRIRLVLASIENVNLVLLSIFGAIYLIAGKNLEKNRCGMFDIFIFIFAFPCCAAAKSNTTLLSKVEMHLAN